LFTFDPLAWCSSPVRATPLGWPIAKPHAATAHERPMIATKRARLQESQ
jgi:hypothetical protein